jgi:hypothetical protein
MVCYQENDNLERINPETTRITPEQEQEVEEDYADLPELEWGSSDTNNNNNVNPAEEDEQVDNDRVERMNYLREQQTEEFYRRFGEESDFFSSTAFQLPEFITRRQAEQAEEEETDVTRFRYINRRRELLSSVLYDNIANEFFLN